MKLLYFMMDIGGVIVGLLEGSSADEENVQVNRHPSFSKLG